jgi:spore maturation protein CgeB
MSHGVNRGIIKSGKFDEREKFIKILIDNNKDIKFDIYGYNFRNPVWSESFYSAISRSSMAINLNRGKPKKYSSSNRIGSLIGNGLLTFIDYKKKFNHFFNNNEIIFYHDHKDLSDKLSYYKKNKEKREKIARNGQKKYFRLFNEVEVADYILKRSFQVDKYKPIWEKFIK